MEDVVLHYQPGSAAGLSSLLERTEKLLETFPCRTPPVFAPWFPAAADRHLPIRPARPAPVITCSGDGLVCAQRTPDGQQKTEAERPRAGTTRTSLENTERPKDGVRVSDTPTCLLPSSPTRQSPEKHRDVPPVPDSGVKRSWSVFTQRRVLLQSSPSLSKHFHHVVSVHKLHLRQRVKWVIGQDNCAASGDIEQVWRALSRSVRSSRLPTCNANIQRERAEIWVFCDVLHSEQVGRILKDELQLSGRIRLSVPRLGHVFSM